MKLTKTTFELDAGLLIQLKQVAARAGKSVRELLTEGAQSAIEKYERLGDHEELARRAKEARKRMREGYFNGAADLSMNLDRLVYAVGERPAEYSSGGKKRRPRK